MNKLIRSFILLALMGVAVKGVSQITTDDLREGLKGNVAAVKTTKYDSFPHNIGYNQVSLFNKGGYIMQTVHADSLKLPATIWKFKYDNKKNLLKLTKTKDGKILSIYTNTYDKGRLSRQNLTTTESAYFKPVKYFFKYNNQGQLIEIYKDMIGIDLRPSRNVFTYDKRGLRATNTIYNREGYLESKSFMWYNKYGDIVKRTYYPDVMSRGKSITTFYRYTYDKEGNWLVKRECLNDSNNFAITQTRKITYY